MKTKPFCVLIMLYFFTSFNLYAKFTAKFVYKKITFCDSENVIKKDRILATSETASVLYLNFRETEAFIDIYDYRFKNNGKIQVWKLKLKSAQFKNKCIKIVINANRTKTVLPLNSVSITDLEYQYPKFTGGSDDSSIPGSIQEESQNRNEPEDPQPSWEMILLQRDEKNC